MHWECWPAFEVFRDCATQWRFSGMGSRTGLDYTAVISVIQFLGVDVSLEHIRYLELGALTAYGGKELEAVFDG